MPTLDANATVGSLVRDRPGRARVLESLKIAYCCSGNTTLAMACEKRGLAIDEVLDKLGTFDASSGAADEIDAEALSLTELADHIEATHHAYLRAELPRLDAMTEKVARVHGDKESRLLRVREAFCVLKAELEPHMEKEERVLFPLVRQLEAAGAAIDHPCGSVANPIRQMEKEHELASGALATIREATDGFVPPEWACNTYRAMIDSLSQLEGDMRQHIHKEDNILFPKAIELESVQ